MSMSKSAIQKLGKRLEVPDGATDEALQLLEDLLIDYDELLSAARGVIDNLCDALEWPIGVTHRLKTTDTLIQKLRRAKEKGQSTNLARVQDIAGIRVSGGITLVEQDDLRDMIIDAFERQGHKCTAKDRREDPMVGYRAVHVVVALGDRYVEVQIRTTGQDLWANVFERIADIFGREIRYGKDPEVGGEAAKDVIASMEGISERLYGLEKMAYEGVGTHGGREATLEAQKPLLDALRSVLEQIETIKGGLPR
ncbi:RelA/SpoT domain-containing protein [Streptomyces sp. R302]|uniref:RelA/SpoT domain-containing protein n=1 Tax=unclassified Streptomyces TaxID=2593676 RepID=UPI00145CD2A7|nr:MULTISPECIES: RelA/SpoT domain-containing protein [unclassified Streptomyces]NML54846.1 RelA/SpoT domain-containing protein [Streptomyces sp. R301]NML83533.1 RelA/SpoT domain-containing protein [Streptomyces sp. R302]